MANGLEYIALSKKAGMLELGEDAAKALVKSGKARLMFVCADTSPGAKRRAEGFVYGCGVPLIEVPYRKEQVSAATGRPGCSMAAFRDLGLAASFASALCAEHGERYREIAEALEAKRAEKRPPGKSKVSPAFSKAAESRGSASGRAPRGAKSPLPRKRQHKTPTKMKERGAKENRGTGGSAYEQL